MRSPPIRSACFAALLLFSTATPASADEALAMLGGGSRGASISELVVRGLSYVGIPYRFGGQSRDTGVDCSALIQRVYHEALGFAIPRTTREQAKLGQRVDLSRLKAGDLVFFNTGRRAFSHVGMYLGDDRFLHAPSGGGEVRVEQLRKHYWVKRFNGGRRILPQPTPSSDIALADNAVDDASPADLSTLFEAPLPAYSPSRPEPRSFFYSP